MRRKPLWSLPADCGKSEENQAKPKKTLSAPPPQGIYLGLKNLLPCPSLPQVRLPVLREGVTSQDLRAEVHGNYSGVREQKLKERKGFAEAALRDSVPR